MQYSYLPQTWTLPAPSTGASLTYRVPDMGAVWILRSIVASYTSDATVVNRTLTIDIRDRGGARKFLSADDTPITASQAATLSGLAFGVSYTDATGLIHHIPVPELVLQGGDLITLSAAGMASGDQWGAASMVVTPDMLPAYTRDQLEIGLG